MSLLPKKIIKMSSNERQFLRANTNIINVTVSDERIGTRNNWVLDKTGP